MRVFKGYHTRTTSLPNIPSNTVTKITCVCSQLSSNLSPTYFDALKLRLCFPHSQSEPMVEDGHSMLIAKWKLCYVYTMNPSLNFYGTSSTSDAQHWRVEWKVQKCYLRARPLRDMAHWCLEKPKISKVSLTLMMLASEKLDWNNRIRHNHGIQELVQEVLETSKCNG